MWQILFLLLLLPAHAASAPLPPYPIEEIIRSAPSVTEAEGRELEQGKILLRDSPEKLLGGMGIAYIKAPPQKVFEIVTDYNHYTDFVPETLACSAVENDANSRLVSAKYKSVWPFDDVVLESLNVHDTHDPKRLLMAWKATHTNLKVSKGFWVIESYKEGSLVFHEMDFDMAWIPYAIAKPSGRKRVIAVVTAVRQRAMQTP